MKKTFLISESEHYFYIGFTNETEERMRVIGNLINEKFIEKFKIDLEENIGYSLEFLIYRALKGFEKQNDNKAMYRAIFSKCNHTVEFINDLDRVLIKNQRVGENFGDFKYMLL